MIRKLFFLLFAPVVAICAQPATPQAPIAVAAKTPLILSRTRLTVGDPDRSFVYLHSRSGGLAATYTLTPATGPAVSIPRTTLAAVDLWWDVSLHGCLQLPATIAPGTYTLDAGRGPEATITVQAAPTRKTMPTLAAGTTAGAINTLANGTNGITDIVLAPGLYTWDQTVSLPTNCRVRAEGAIIKRLATNPIGDKYPIFYIAGQEVSVYGPQFVDCPGGTTLFSNPTSSGLVLVDCRFKRSNLGFYHASAFVRDCVLESGGAIIAPSGLWLRTKFLGPSVGDPMQFWAGIGSAQWLDCVWDKTERGPVFNAIGQSIESPLFCGAECHDIVRGNNGNECWLCEGGPVNNLMTLHSRVRGCESSVFQFDGGASNALIRDFTIDGGLGIIWKPATPGATITGCTVQDFQFLKAGFYAGPGVSGCTLQDGLMIGFAPTRGNQTFNNGSPLLYSRTVAAWFDGSAAGANTMSNVPVLALSPGITAVQGVVPVTAK